MTATTPAFAHLFVLLACEAPVGVIFRRGPRDWTQMIHWDTKKDIFTLGQWFKGRLYLQRSGLSPNGKLLIYFAAKYHRPSNPPHSFPVWTAISKPPYFTALRFLSDFDTYGGGGIFIDDHTVFHNNTSPTDGVWDRPHPGLTIISKPGFFSPTALYYHHLWSNGWKWIEHEPYTDSDSMVQPLFGEDALPASLFQRGIEPIKWYKEVGQYKLIYTYTFKKVRYELTHHKKDYADPLDKVEWADFDHRGRIILAKQGKLFTATFNHQGLALKELADFNMNKFYPLEPPDWAKKW
jgi:hypothetical protein